MSSHEPVTICVVQLLGEDCRTIREQHIFDTEDEAEAFERMQQDVHNASTNRFSSTNHCDPQKMMKTAMDRLQEMRKKMEKQ